MPGPRIAHGLFTWQDGRPALEASLLSTAGHVDEVLIADGLIQGVDPRGLPFFSDLSWLQDADYLPPRVPCSVKEWRSLSAACTWLLAKARELECEWLVYVDADQELHNGHLLREHLAAWQRWAPDSFAYPLVRLDRHVGFHSCPWQAIYVPAVSEYVAGCFVVNLHDGSQRSLVPLGDTRVRAPAKVPWLSHHPERRPQGRQEHRLGELETVLEPPPREIESLRLEPYLLPSAAMSDEQTGGRKPTYYCPACGQRYHGPGVCDYSHEPTDLEKLPGSGGGGDAGGKGGGDSKGDKAKLFRVGVSHKELDAYAAKHGITWPDGATSVKQKQAHLKAA